MIKLFTAKQFDKAKRGTLLPVRCVICRKIFEITKHRIQDCLNPSRNDKAEFCSHKCAGQYLSKKHFISCTECKKEFLLKNSEFKKKTNNKFCSRSCHCKFNNRTRKGSTVSKIEKYIQNKIKLKFPELEVCFNSSELIGLELDIFIPLLSLAFEINGPTHYRPIFGAKRLEGTMKRDKLKINKCNENFIELIVVDISKYVKNQNEVVSNGILSLIGLRLKS